MAMRCARFDGAKLADPRAMAGCACGISMHETEVFARRARPLPDKHGIGQRCLRTLKNEPGEGGIERLEHWAALLGTDLP
jgi:hypothetical protein